MFICFILPAVLGWKVEKGGRSVWRGFAVRSAAPDNIWVSQFNSPLVQNDQKIVLYCATDWSSGSNEPISWHLRWSHAEKWMSLNVFLKDVRNILGCTGDDLWTPTDPSLLCIFSKWCGMSVNLHFKCSFSLNGEIIQCFIITFHRQLTPRKHLI